MPRRRGKRHDGEGHPTAPTQRRAADGGRRSQGPAPRSERRGELGEAYTLTHSGDCCDTSRERENPEQSCLLGRQEKPMRSCTARCPDLAPAATLCGLHLSWVLRGNGVCSSSKGALGPPPAPAPISLGQGRRALPCLCCTQHRIVDPQFTGQTQPMGTCHRSLLVGQGPVCSCTHTQAPQLMQTLQPHQPV